MVLEAALVTLAIIELLVRIGRVALFPAVYEHLVATFESAGMRDNALKALEYVQRQARSRTVTVDDVERVRAFMYDLKTNPASSFAA